MPLRAWPILPAVSQAYEQAGLGFENIAAILDALNVGVNVNNILKRSCLKGYFWVKSWAKIADITLLLKPDFRLT